MYITGWIQYRRQDVEESRLFMHLKTIGVQMVHRSFEKMFDLATRDVKVQPFIA